MILGFPLALFFVGMLVFVFIYLPNSKSPEPEAKTPQIEKIKEPEKYKITVLSDIEGAIVYVNDKPVSTTGTNHTARFELESGEYTITINHLSDDELYKHTGKNEVFISESIDVRVTTKKEATEKWKANEAKKEIKNLLDENEILYANFLRTGYYKLLRRELSKLYYSFEGCYTGRSVTGAGNSYSRRDSIKKFEKFRYAYSLFFDKHQLYKKTSEIINTGEIISKIMKNLKKITTVYQKNIDSIKLEENNIKLFLRSFDNKKHPFNYEDTYFTERQIFYNGLYEYKGSYFSIYKDSILNSKIFDKNPSINESLMGKVKKEYNSIHNYIKQFPTNESVGGHLSLDYCYRVSGHRKGKINDWHLIIEKAIKAIDESYSDLYGDKI